MLRSTLSASFPVTLQPLRLMKCGFSNYLKHLNKRISKGKRRKGKASRSPYHAGEGKKSVRRMPRRQGPKKDVVHCEKPRGAVCKRRSEDIRMGKPAGQKDQSQHC